MSTTSLAFTLTYYISKNDFWYFQNDNIPGRGDNKASYIIGIGGVDIAFPPNTRLVELRQNIAVGEITAVVSERERERMSDE